MSEFSTASSASPPILIWRPEGGVPGGPVSNPPVYSQADVTQLVEGQAYVDVVFGSIQTTEDWVLVACEVENTTDFEPLNIWPGIITDRTAAGFRLQLNGLPDSNNYYLHWAVSGINITPSVASTYLFSGPSSGPYDAFGAHSSNFTVALPPSTTIPGAMIVTPDDGGAGGTFSPATVTLTASSRIANFTYSPAGYGVVTITVTNSMGLIDPAGIAFTAVAAAYTLTGPSGGSTGSPSTNFTVALPVGGLVIGTVTVTPSSGGGGGTFTPATVALTTGAPSATFTYTAATAGAKTISVTNNGGLTDPASITYTAVAPFSPDSIAGLKGWWKADAGTSLLRDALADLEIAMPMPTLSDGDPVVMWADQSGNGNHLTIGGPFAPTFKTNIVNGKPVIRFDGVNDKFNVPVLGVSQPNTWFLVINETNKAAQCLPIWNTAATGQIIFLDSSGHINIYAGSSPPADSVDFSGAFHIICVSFSASNGTLYVDGNFRFGPSASGPNGTGGIFDLMSQAGSYYPGDIAEILLYNSALGTTDRDNVTNYLKARYAIA